MGYMLETTELFPRKAPLLPHVMELETPSDADNSDVPSSIAHFLATATDVQQSKAKYVLIQIFHTKQYRWEWFKETASTDSIFEFCDKFVSPDNHNYVLEEIDSKVEEKDKIIKRGDAIQFTEKRFTASHRLHFRLILNE